MNTNRNIFIRLTSLIKDYLTDIIEGYLTSKELIKIYICLIIFSTVFLAGVVL
jgi:hypothetical protein